MARFVSRPFQFSLKNIPIPGKDAYLKDLIHRTESFITRLRWKVFFFLKRNNRDDNEEYEEPEQKET